MNWNQIKAEYASGTKLKDLANNYSLSIDTIRSRYRREKWSELRTKTKQQTNNKIIDELSSKEANRKLNAVEVIDHAINELLLVLPEAKLLSKESIARAINELLRTRGLYTGETTTNIKNENQFQVNADEVIRATIEYLDSKPPRDAEDLAIPPKELKANNL